FRRGFVLILVFTGSYVPLTVLAVYLLGDRVHGRLAEVDAVGTHVGDLPALIQLLRQQHGAADGIAQLTAGFLLKSGCREWGGGCFFTRLDLYVRDGVVG